MKLTLNIKKTDLQTLFNTRKYLFFAGTMVVISVTILLVGVAAQASGFLDLITASNQEQPVLQSLKNKVQGLKQVNYLTEFSQNSQVDLALPSGKPLLQLISGVNAVAQQAGVTLSDIQTTPGKLATKSATTSVGIVTPGITDTTSNIPGVNVLTVGMIAHGNLDQINTFLDGIEKITPITQASKLRLTLAPVIPVLPGSVLATNSAFPKADRYDAELALSTYYFAQSISLTTDSPLPPIGAKEEAFLKKLSVFQFPSYQQQQQVQGGGSTDLFGAQ